MGRQQIKLILFFILIGSNLNSIYGQRRLTYAFEKNIFLADFSTSLGLYKERDFVSQRIPLFIGTDIGVSDQLAFGLYAGWSQRTRKPANYAPYDINYYYYGARFSWHFTKWLSDNTPIKLDRRNVDVYATIWGGRNLAREVIFAGSSVGNGNVSALGGYIGARIYTMYRVGVLVELGAGPFGVMNLGVCVKI
jgi:hypothetical protein